MKTASDPDFTPLASQRWESIPEDSRQQLLSSVWCSGCHRKVTITKFSGAIRNGALLLVGKCAECHADIARVI